MRRPDVLIVRRQRHIDPAVAAGGFELGHRYLRECWAPLLGEPATRLLERLPRDWQRTGDAAPKRVEMARDLGLGSSRGGRRSFERALDRIVEYGFAEWVPFVDRGIPKHDRGELAVYTRMSPLGDHDLEQVSPAVRARHDELAGPILDRAFPSSAIDIASLTERAAYLARPAHPPSHAVGIEL